MSDHGWQDFCVRGIVVLKRAQWWNRNFTRFLLWSFEECVFPAWVIHDDAKTTRLSHSISTNPNKTYSSLCWVLVLLKLKCLGCLQNCWKLTLAAIMYRLFKFKFWEDSFTNLIAMSTLGNTKPSTAAKIASWTLFLVVATRTSTSVRQRIFQLLHVNFFTINRCCGYFSTVQPHFSLFTFLLSLWVSRRPTPVTMWSTTSSHWIRSHVICCLHLQAFHYQKDQVTDFSTKPST